MVNRNASQAKREAGLPARNLLRWKLGWSWQADRVPRWAPPPVWVQRGWSWVTQEGKPGCLASASKLM